MKPNTRMLRWLKRKIPKDCKPIDIIPRAYCVAKPAPGCAVLVTPPMDYRRHLCKPELRSYYEGLLIQVGDASGIHLGDWVTVIYASKCKDGHWVSSLWYWTKAIPLHYMGGGEK